ncbi:scavenger receptor class B member 1-like isoform X2 [Ornithodoros turicata]|uniref:scavenger receptor class B member 1-like isoform X2 n=1 Tax=Ornithodoros turicata TaxID=34597 RepID=UPI003138F6C7
MLYRVLHVYVQFALQFFKLHLVAARQLFRELYLRSKAWSTKDSCQEDYQASGKMAVITGGIHGIGFETTRQLLALGVNVVIGSPTPDQHKFAELSTEFSSSKVTWFHLDLRSMTSVRDFSQRILDCGADIDVLICNAGVMFVPQQDTEDGFEMHMSVNYLGHCLLTCLLMPRLRSRIVNVTSCAHKATSINFADLHGRQAYSRFHGYCQSKRAQVLWTAALGRRLRDKMTVLCVHPGVVDSSLYRHVWWAPLASGLLFKRLVLEPGNQVFSSWEQVPIPIYVSYYLFNVTNPEGILQGTEKPRLEEIGPFTFRETREKVNVSWHENGTLSYRQLKRYYFQPDRTHGSFDDAIVTLNVPMVSAAYATKYQEETSFFKYAISSIIEDTDSTFFVKRLVRELLFEGYEDPLIETAIEMDMDVPADKFGWMYGKNGSDDGQYSIFSGLKGMEDYGFVDNFNGMSNMTAFHGHCNTLSGTTGDMWPPESLEDAETVELFLAEFCRSIRLRYLTEVLSHGVRLRRYWADNQLFNYSLPENRCFCGDSCFPSGVLNVSACQHGAPLVISYPHFLYADPSYEAAMDGLRPDPQKHIFHMDIEPKLGIPVHVAARFQVNLWLERIEGVTQFDNITDPMFYPMFWFETLASADEDTTAQLRLVTEELPQYVTAASFGSIILGAIILLGTLVYAIRYTKRPKPR